MGKWRSHVHPEDLEALVKAIDFLIKNRRQRIKVEYRFRCADGSYRFVQDRAFILFDDSDQPIRIIGSMQDITEQVRRLKAIEEQNTRLREISWIQSHKIRSPLSQIMGLVSLINLNDINSVCVKELIPHLKASSEELDLVLKEIIKKTHYLS